MGCVVGSRGVWGMWGAQREIWVGGVSGVNLVYKLSDMA